MKYSEPNLRIKESSPVKSRHEFFVPIGNKNMKKKSPVENKNYHFIGIGGVGTSALALMLMKEKAIVSGSDMQKSVLADRLIDCGADIKIGHSAGNLPENLDGVIISAAVKEDNPELIAARKRKLMVYKYAQMLGLVMNRYRGIAISGTHGKSTTSGWLVFTLKQLGIDPNYVVGADITQLGNSSGIGGSDLFVAEACEYDRSFLNLYPKIGVILNLEQDHLDYYSDLSQIVDAFSAFAANIASDGVLIAGCGDTNVTKILADSAGQREIITFGIGPTADISAQNIKYEQEFTEFDFFCNGGAIGAVKIHLPGEHNVQNALAVLACLHCLGVDLAEAIKHIGNFEGMDRRFMKKGQVDDIVVLDDYAHHPTEIKAMLKAVRQKYGQRKIYCIFQPHQYSRTRFLLKDFAESFKFADMTIVPEIYFVRDTAEAKNEINSQMLVDKICGNGSKAVFIDSFESICDFLKNNVESGSIVITTGAGNIWKVADEYIQWLRKNS